MRHKLIFLTTGLAKKLGPRFREIFRQVRRRKIYQTRCPLFSQLLEMLFISMLTVWLPRFLILQTRWVALPVTPVTSRSASVMSNHGPEREPVGFGVARSYSLSRSPLFDDRQRWAGWAGDRRERRINNYFRFQIQTYTHPAL